MNQDITEVLKLPENSFIKEGVVLDIFLKTGANISKGERMIKIKAQNGIMYLKAESNYVVGSVFVQVGQILKSGDLLCKVSGITSYEIVFNDITIMKAVKEWLQDPLLALSKYGDISTWNTSQVTDMSKLFLNAKHFNEPIGSWDVSNVTTMYSMFENAIEFNQPLCEWDTSKVEDMSKMFSASSPTKYNQPMSSWNVSNVKDMNHMFYNAACFNQDINSWNVSKVENISGMFSDAVLFNSPLNNWNTSAVNKMRFTFKNAISFNQSLSEWNVCNVKDFHGMFYKSTTFNQPISHWDTAKADDFSYMFFGAHQFNQPIGAWNVSNVKSFNNMFEMCYSFNQSLSSWNVSNSKSFNSMFCRAHSFNCSLNDWDVSNGKHFSYMFLYAESFNFPMDNWEINIPDFKISSEFNGFLMNAKSFNQDIKGWIDKYSICGDEGDPFKGVKSISGNKQKKQKVVNVDRKNISLLSSKTTNLFSDCKSFDEFKLLKVNVIQGWDFQEHPAVRNKNNVLNFHTGYEYSIENIGSYAASPICRFTIQVGDNSYNMIYMKVGIDNPLEDEKEFIGLDGNSRKESLSIECLRKNVLWFHETELIDDKCKDNFERIGFILSIEDESHNVFDFYYEYDDIPVESFSWETLNL